MLVEIFIYDNTSHALKRQQFIFIKSSRITARVGVILSRIKCSEFINFKTIYCSSAQKREHEEEIEGESS